MGVINLMELREGLEEEIGKVRGSEANCKFNKLWLELLEGSLKL